MKTIAIAVLIINLFVSCNKDMPEIERAFYYWKSNDYNLSDAELNCLKDAQTQKLYVKFFEVEKDKVFGTKPISKTSLHIWDCNTSYFVEMDSGLCAIMHNLEIIPTVFIKNDVFYKISKPGLDSLADNILFLCNKYYKKSIKNNNSDFKEIQMDCDWTAKTKDNYFYFLKSLKILSQKKLSCTLRLYPYKYPDLMGIPPVDKAMLMCYNLTNPLENENNNSIQDNRELEKYLRNAKQYPVHLDIALPAFSWIQLYQNNQFVAIIKSQQDEIKEISEKIKPLWYEIQKDLVVGDLYLRAGDKIKIEESSAEESLKSLSLLKKNIDFDSTTCIALFHLDTKNMENYRHEELNHFYTVFSNWDK